CLSYRKPLIMLATFVHVASMLQRKDRHKERSAAVFCRRICLFSVCFFANWVHAHGTPPGGEGGSASEVVFAFLDVGHKNQKMGLYSRSLSVSSCKTVLIN